ncbi:unnamed protein product [Adineta steineri]|uniref:Uncharacterized protein n=1 Tax=Adineta steineri TaxID=433720 RepID=A0A814V7A0_9BILA|nr:unnamed protein product [Adineta steineri]CAF1416727.1 unnamed protein product [Adineta steineri]CAF1508638.1 unnamed protein product [Adineta steineri]CAF1646639.1 unnamed protein product [Adineta steineri]
MDEETLASSRFSKGKIYGVLRAQVTSDNGEYHSDKSKMTHYNLITTDDGPNQMPEQYQINIDIQSRDAPNVKCVSFDSFSIDNFQVSDLPYGFTPLRSDSDEPMAIDLVRKPLFDVNLLTQSTALSADEIATKLDNYLKEGNPNVIVFGTKYDDGYHQPEKHYGLQRAAKQQKPSRGIDDVHLNQNIGNDGSAYQDGALFIETGDSDQKNYVAFFFCFANQCGSESNYD